MLSKIQEIYKSYNKIHNELLSKSNDSLDNEMARNLFENSLYLSVFTTFESFLKELIENYLDNISKRGITFTQLSEGFAKAVFFANEKRISKLFTSSNDKQREAFGSYFKDIKKGMTRKELEKYIHFEFLHESKLNSYYKDLFEQILGERDFLNNLKLIRNGEDFKGLLNIEGDVVSFLHEYTTKIRNNIAHQNWSFKICDFSDFERVTDAFLFIISEIIKKYEEHTGFRFIKKDKNILDDF